MKTIKHIIPIGLGLVSLLSAIVQADEKSMNEALAQWQQELSEYQSAIKLTKDESQRNILIANPPDGVLIGKKLWKSIGYKTGTKEVKQEKKTAPTSRFDIPKVTKVPVYAYEEAWASPAVAWLLSNPKVLTSIMEEQQVNKLVTLLVNSVIANHYDKPIISSICAPISTLSSIQAYECLQKIYLHNPDMTAKANAALGLSLLLNKTTIRSVEGSEAMADAKRIYYIKEALDKAPKGCMFGQMTIEAVSQEQIHLVSKLSPGRIPPQVKLFDSQKRASMFPLVNQAQILLFWSPDHMESLTLMRRSKELAEKYPNIKIIPIAIGVDQEDLQQICQEEGIDTLSYSDPNGDAAKEYRANVLPYVAFIGDSNTLNYIGYPDLNFQSEIVKFLEQKKSSKATNNSSPIEEQPTGNKSAVPKLREIPEL